MCQDQFHQIKGYSVQWLLISFMMQQAKQFKRMEENVKASFSMLNAKFKR
jgi:hypothetical protein